MTIRTWKGLTLLNHKNKFILLQDCYLSAIVTWQRVQPLNRSVLFVKETDFLYTSDKWRVVIEIDLSAYHDTISVIRSDLMIIEQQKQEFTPVAELKHVDSLLKTIDSRLNDFQQVLPRLDPRRGLLDLGGLVLKQVFGTATLSDYMKY